MRLDRHSAFQPICLGLVQPKSIPERPVHQRQLLTLSHCTPGQTMSLAIKTKICCIDICRHRRNRTSAFSFALVQTGELMSRCNCTSDMHHLSCGISSLLHSLNLILFTALLVHLILCISPHHGHHLRSHHLSLPWPFTLDLKLVSFINRFSFLQSFFLSDCLHRSLTCTELNGIGVCFCFSFLFFYIFFWLHVID